MIKNAENINNLGTILMVWAHPDDETFTAGGLISMAANNGQKVICVTATKGEKGGDDPNLGEIRKHELKDALSKLGKVEHIWLNFKDGECNDVPIQEGAELIEAVINMYHPDTIVTVGPEGYTGHDDHMRVSRWASSAVDGTDISLFRVVNTQKQYDNYLKALDNKLNFFFNIENPPVVDETHCDLLLELPPEVVDKKCEALKAQKSQTQKMFSEFDEAFLKQSFATEAFVQVK